jgi:hypothetical protein
MEPFLRNRSHEDEGRPDFMATLGLLPPYAVEDVKQAYFEKVKSAHPDAGGSVHDFLKLQQAFEKAIQYAEFRASRMKWLATNMERFVTQSLVVQSLIDRGAQVDTEQFDWLKRWFGDDFAQVTETVVEIALQGPRVTDETIEFLVKEYRTLDRLKRLDLHASRISDAGLQCLRVFTRLEKLDIRGTPTTVRAVKVANWFPTLIWLGIDRKRLPCTGRLWLRWHRPQLELTA